MEPPGNPGRFKDEAEDFLWSFLEEAIEGNGLLCGGGGKAPAWSFLVTLARRGSPSSAQREAVGRWLAQQPQVVSHSLGEPWDVWHGPDPEDAVAPESAEAAP